MRYIAIGAMLGLVIGGVARCSDAVNSPDPVPAPTTPVYPLGHAPTDCGEYILTNTYHEGC